MSELIAIADPAGWNARALHALAVITANARRVVVRCHTDLDSPIKKGGKDLPHKSVPVAALIAPSAIFRNAPE